MKPITKTELIKRINEIKGTTIIAVDIVSEPKMRKTNNPYLGTTKVTTLSGIIGYSYENSVNLQLEREGKEADFKAQPRAWGTYENNWIAHKGNYYLPIKVQGSSDPVFVREGVEIKKEVLEPFLYDSNKPHTQEGLEKEIVVRDIKIDSIRVIRMMGEEYMVV